MYIYGVFTSKRLPQKGCHYSLFHPRGIIRWLTNFEKWAAQMFTVGKVSVWACGCQTMHAFLAFLRLFIRCFFLWLHVETISDFLFGKFCLFLSFKIQSFSSEHKLHLFDPPVYEIDCFNTDQVIKFLKRSLIVNFIWSTSFRFK